MHQAFFSYKCFKPQRPSFAQRYNPLKAVSTNWMVWACTHRLVGPTEFSDVTSGGIFKIIYDNNKI